MYNYKYNYFPKLCAGGGETFTVDDDASHSQVLGNVLVVLYINHVIVN